MAADASPSAEHFSSGLHGIACVPPVPQVSMWDISSVAASSPNQLQPLSTTPVPAGDLQTWIIFSQQDATELVTSGCKRVVFWRQQQDQRQPMSFSCPSFRPAEFQQSVGDFLASAFVPNTTQVGATNTGSGAVLLAGCM
jgi:hypothetical protein